MFAVPDIRVTKAIAEAKVAAQIARRREGVWTQAWVAVASSLNGKTDDCTRYADACLRAFDERFLPENEKERGTKVQWHSLTGER